MTVVLAVFLIIGLSFLFTAGLRAGVAVDDKRHATYPQQRPFLGGSDPETHALQRFHIRYYTMTLLFVAFEMEMMFMYPWAVVYREEGLVALLDMGVFLAILFLGLLYGWSQGALRRQ